MVDKSAVNLHISDTDYPVSEMFESIQGEGNYAGVNCLFVRFQLCNLRCPWCDTKHTWTRFSDMFDVVQADALARTIRDRSKSHVIFTGGEPSLFRLDLLIGPDTLYHVETNGTLIPTQPLKMTLTDGVVIDRDAMDEAVISQFNWVVSPKLSNSKQPLESEAMAFWVEQPYAIFKFIVDTEQDLDEVEAFIDRFSIRKNQVYMGLLGTTASSQLRPDLVENIIKRGYHVSPRLHILLWGKARGK
ncbi:MAG: 7-carboxy-7-deazaguanine synthase QueE [Planctomycetes bacterium]|nr:7-carboxy-7-deazaguanine synthase QueE [Planctomycetota bacterium]